MPNCNTNDCALEDPLGGNRKLLAAAFPCNHVDPGVRNARPLAVDVVAVDTSRVRIIGATVSIVPFAVKSTLRSTDA